MQTYETYKGPVTKIELLMLKALEKFKGEKKFSRHHSDHEVPIAYLDKAFGKDSWKNLNRRGFLKCTADFNIRRVGHFKNMFRPSETPITPGIRKPYVSNRIPDSEFGHIPINALEILASKPSVINQFMAQKIKDAEWSDSTPEAVIRSAKNTAWSAPKIYHDAWLDWRGRVYCQTGDHGSVFHNKAVRAMIDAPQPEEIDRRGNAFKYMLKVIAHEFDVTLENFRNVRDSTITNTNDALRVRAAHAIHEVITTGKTAYLMEQDASCSGGQIISLLTGDAKLAAATNCIKQKDKGDLYTTISEDERLQGLWHFLDLAGTDPKSKKARRTIAKPVVMISFYGGQPKSILTHLWLKHDGEFITPTETKDRPEPTGVINIGGDWEIDVTTAFLLIQIMAGIITQFEGFAKIKAWAQSHGANIADDLGGDFSWTTATGFKATNHSITATGFMPNFVHSIDGAIVQVVINKAHAEGINLSTVHDAFFTTPNNALRLREIVQNAYKYVIANTDIPNWTKKKLTPNLELLEQIEGSTLIGEPFDTKAATVTA